MNNISHIYDIDNELLRDVNNTDKLTIDEAKARLKKYEDKLANIVKDETQKHKIGIYRAYITNLQRYIINYSIENPNMIPRPEKTEDQIKKAMEELKESIDNHVEDTPMDSYVDFEEVKDEQPGNE